MQRHLTIWSSFGTVLLLCGSPCSGAQQGFEEQPQQQSPSAGASQPTHELDQQALDLIRSAARHIEQSESFTVRMTHSLEVHSEQLAQDLTHRSMYRLAFEQPNRMRLEMADSGEGELMVSDGQSLYAYFPSLNRYVERDAPSDLRGLLSGETGMGAGIGGPLTFIGPLLVPDAIDGEAGIFRRAQHLGAEEIDGVTMQRLSLIVAAPPDLTPDEPQSSNVSPQGEQPQPGEAPPDPTMPQDSGESPHTNAEAESGNDSAPLPDFVFDVWVEEAEDGPLLRRMYIDLTRTMQMMTEQEQTTPPNQAEDGAAASPPGLPNDTRYDMWIVMDDWEFNQPIPEERFEFTPPPGAERADSLIEALVGGAQGEPQHPLLGEPAPNFELQRLEGTQMELASHRGDVVILDFWATWCTPCVRAMPHIMSIAEEFSDDVVLYAINLREDFSTVESFISERGWDELMVAMDVDGTVAELYSVRSIPQTVIIDREGVVQAVHIGFSSQLESRLRGEIQTLIDGGSLLDENEPEGEEGSLQE